MLPMLMKIHNFPVSSNIHYRKVGVSVFVFGSVHMSQCLNLAQIHALTLLKAVHSVTLILHFQRLLLYLLKNTVTKQLIYK